MKKTAILLTALWLLAAVPQARAQYYNTGQSPASLRGKSIGNDSLQVVFPDGFGKQAHRTLFYMDTVRSRISYGYPLPPLKTPVMMTTENFFSGGYLKATAHLGNLAVEPSRSRSARWSLLMTAPSMSKG